MAKVRLDELLFEKKLANSIKESAALVMSGLVYIDDKKCDKPGLRVNKESNIFIKESLKYVSRGGLKLEKVVKLFDINFSNKIVLDIGASTGGFTDVALQNKANKIHTVDVGRNLLHYRLRQRKEIVIHDGINFRYISFDVIGEKVDIILCDVSFISITKLFNSMLQFCKDRTDLIFLIKPQFEAESKFVGKNGIIKSADIHFQTIYRVIKCAINVGFSFKGITISPIKGTKGNTEYLTYFLYKKTIDIIEDETIEDIIKKIVYENNINYCKATC